MTKQLPPKHELEYKSYKDVCKEYNISAPTARKWLAHYGIHGYNSPQKQN